MPSPGDTPRRRSALGPPWCSCPARPGPASGPAVNHSESPTDGPLRSHSAHCPQTQDMAQRSPSRVCVCTCVHTRPRGHRREMLGQTVSSRTPGSRLIPWGKMTEPERRAKWPKSRTRLFELEKAIHSAESSLRKAACASADTRLEGGTALGTRLPGHGSEARGGWVPC